MVFHVPWRTCQAHDWRLPQGKAPPSTPHGAPWIHTSYLQQPLPTLTPSQPDPPHGTLPHPKTTLPPSKIKPPIYSMK